MACKCPERLLTMLRWMGYDVPLNGDWVSITTKRGRVELPLNQHTTRIALMAMFVRVVL